MTANQRSDTLSTDDGSSRQEKNRHRMSQGVKYEYDERTEVLQVSGQKSGKIFISVVPKPTKC